MAVNSVRFLYSATSPKLFKGLSPSEWTYLSDKRFEDSPDCREMGMRGNRHESMGFLCVTPQRSVHPRLRSNDNHPPRSTGFIVLRCKTQCPLRRMMHLHSHSTPPFQSINQQRRIVKTSQIGQGYSNNIKRD